MKVRKLHIEELTIEEFSKKFGIENSDDVLSDDFADEFERNGYNIYYIDGGLESALRCWEEEYEGSFGDIEINLDFYYVSHMFVSVWK